jgi:hypothetical protein
VRIEGLGLHVEDVEDAPLGVDERDREGDQRVLHPHALVRGLVEDEEHPVVAPERLAVHEALHSLRVRDGDLDVERMGADLHVRGLERDLGIRRERRRRDRDAGKKPRGRAAVQAYSPDLHHHEAPTDNENSSAGW